MTTEKEAFTDIDYAFLVGGKNCSQKAALLIKLQGPAKLYPSLRSNQKALGEICSASKNMRLWIRIYD